MNNKEIKRCSSSCKIMGGREIGGISGKNNGSIINCFFSGSISDIVFYNTTTRYGEYMGGIAGYNSSRGGQISFCYSTGSIKGVSNI